jgi:hypothetical protein
VVCCCCAAGDLWLLNADDASTLLDAVMESFRIQDRAVSSEHDNGASCNALSAAASVAAYLQLQQRSSSVTSSNSSNQEGMLGGAALRHGHEAEQCLPGVRARS